MPGSVDIAAGATPRVSIGMPVYNAAKHLPGAIDSFLAQGFADFELIISDNASTDRTGDIARRYAARDPRIRYVRQPRNIGAAGNFAYVLGEARGDFFQWAAHDDLWRPFWLERAVAALDAEPEIGFAFPSFAIKDQIFGFLDEYDPGIFAFVESRDSRARLLHFLALHFSHKCNIVYSLFRTEFMRQAIQSQGLENDGVLAAVCVGRAKGKVIAGFPFLKRWGLVRSWIRRAVPLSQRREANFRNDVARSVPVLEVAFPWAVSELRVIMEAMRPGHFPKGYRVVDVERLLDHAAVAL
ncbi:glycosyl transferase family 2 [Roseicyclus mahoneyensis]|uniref:Glycosyl transferase family 2 n=1 Tax=Roseicyclus mahoneyensis TaxID=164332 RepID=A0A316GF55_9RHOB|nr:glycosyl transferase family 2 [Roseicyclus mahoneyensis]